MTSNLCNVNIYVAFYIPALFRFLVIFQYFIQRRIVDVENVFPLASDVSLAHLNRGMRKMRLLKMRIIFVHLTAQNSEIFS